MNDEYELGQNPAQPWKLVAGIKILVLVLVIGAAGGLFIWQRKTAQINTAQSTAGFTNLINQAANDAILTIPYQQTLYKHFGNAINPQIKIPVKTINGFKEMEFLVDSGAVVSALPQSLAEELGADLTQLPRITIEGFAGQKTFAYRGDFVIKIGKEEIAIPVVFSENPDATKILGRIGFFDDFNIVFNAKTKSITISKKG